MKMAADYQKITVFKLRAPSLHTLMSSMTRSHDHGLGFALFVGNPTRREQIDVKVVPSANEKVQSGAPLSSARKKVQILSPLPSASEEVKYIAPLFEAQPLVDSEATKERDLKCIPGANIIHISAHGEQNSGEISLAPNPNKTGQNSKRKFLSPQKKILISSNSKTL